MTFYDHPPIVLVDMDGVQADLEGAFWREWATRHPDLPQYADVQHLTFKIETRFGDRYHEEVASILDEPGFFAGFEPYKGAAEAMNAMVGRGWDVFVVTSPLLTNVTCGDDKFGWMDHHIGFGWSDRTIITRDKTLVRGDVLIDDKPVIKGRLTPTWKHVVFDRTYNHDAPSPYRMHDWADWEQTLTPLLGRIAA